jgi:hypothetical protein
MDRWLYEQTLATREALGGQSCRKATIVFGDGFQDNKIVKRIDSF